MSVRSKQHIKKEIKLKQRELSEEIRLRIFPIILDTLYKRNRDVIFEVHRDAIIRSINDNKGKYIKNFNFSPKALYTMHRLIKVAEGIVGDETNKNLFWNSNELTFFDYEKTLMAIDSLMGRVNKFPKRITTRQLMFEKTIDNKGGKKSMPL